jgi:tripeptidyl-peptidase-1
MRALSAHITVMYWTLVFLIGLAHFCFSAPLVKRWDDLVEKHSWAEVPRGWHFVGPAPADHTLHLRIALKQARFDQLVQSLLEISDPRHEQCV